MRFHANYQIFSKEMTLIRVAEAVLFLLARTDVYLAFVRAGVALSSPFLSGIV